MRVSCVNPPSRYKRRLYVQYAGVDDGSEEDDPALVPDSSKHRDDCEGGCNELEGGNGGSLTVLKVAAPFLIYISSASGTIVFHSEACDPHALAAPWLRRRMHRV